MAKNFEEYLNELEEISKKLSDGDISLDESIKLYENGMKLSKKCQELLENAEKKVMILRENSDGGMSEEPFEDIK